MQTNLRLRLFSMLVAVVITGALFQSVASLGHPPGALRPAGAGPAMAGRPPVAVQARVAG